MGKRGNEHGQMRKEEFEAAMASGSRNADPGVGIDLASDDVLRSRRLIRSKRPMDATTTITTPIISSSRTTNTNTSTSDGSSNAFGSVNFGGGLPSFGSAPAPAAGGFSFGSISTATTAPAPASTMQPFFAQPQPTKRRRINNVAAQQAPEPQDEATTAEQIKLAEGTIKFLAKLPHSRIIPTKALDSILMTRANLDGKKDSETSGGMGGGSVAGGAAAVAAGGVAQSTSAAPTPFVAGGSGLVFGNASSSPAPASATSNLFGVQSAAKSSPSPSPAAPVANSAACTSNFSFGSSGGGATVGTPAPSAASASLFAFGSSGGGTSSMSASPTAAPSLVFKSAQPPVPAPVPVPFSFPKVAVPLPVPPTVPPVAGANDDATAPGDGNTDDDGDAVQETIDPNWNTVYRTTARMYRVEKGCRTILGRGEMKLQRHTSNGSRRLLTHTKSGGVVANVAIPLGMSFKLIKSKPEAEKKSGQILFMGVLEAGQDPLTLGIVTNFDKLDETVEKLKQLALP